MSYQRLLTITLGPAYAGLPSQVGITFYDQSGVISGVRLTNLTDLGNGDYQTYATITSGFIGSYRGDSGTGALPTVYTPLIGINPSSDEGALLLAAGLDNVLVETGINARQLLSLLGAALGGLVSGVGTSVITIRAVNNAGTTRIVATVDGVGNRTAIVLTPPA